MPGATSSSWLSHGDGEGAKCIFLVPFLPLSLHPASTSLKFVHCSPSTPLSPKPKTPLPGSVSCPVFRPPVLKPEGFLLKYYNLFITPGELIMYGSHHSLLPRCQWLPTALKINSRLRKTSGPLTCSRRPFQPPVSHCPTGPLRFSNTELLSGTHPMLCLLGMG